VGTKENLKFIVHIDHSSPKDDTDERIAMVTKIKKEWKWENEVMFYCDWSKDVEKVKELRNEKDIFVTSDVEVVKEWAMEMINVVGCLKLIKVHVPARKKGSEIYFKLMRGKQELKKTDKSKKSKDEITKELDWEV